MLLHATGTAAYWLSGTRIGNQNILTSPITVASANCGEFVV